MQAAAATDKRTKQGRESEVEKGENHVLDPRSPRQRRADTNIGALQDDEPDEPAGEARDLQAPALAGCVIP
jgi:hypothetical protein